ncbi:MAG: FliH/SctL family protein [Balneolaceae bacterium]
MSRKIIDNRQIEWFDKEISRLSYRMIFDDRAAAASEEPGQNEEEQQSVDVAELLHRRDRLWGGRLKEARKEAYQQGFQEGLDQGLEEGRSEAKQHLEELERVVKQGVEEWRARQQLLEPGLTDLLFEITEKILQIPISQPEMQELLEREIGMLLQRMGEGSRPVLHVSEQDMELMEKLILKYAQEIPVSVHSDESLLPGEFRLETDRERVAREYRALLKDFKDSLTLPTWKQP